jgi:hypothetical protein
MTSKRYLGNIITDTPTAPAGPYENDAASGVWSLAGNTVPAYGLFMGGYTPSATANIEYINIATTGNASNWSTLSYTMAAGAGCASTTRAFFFPGYRGGSAVATISYVTFTVGSTSTDFGDQTYENSYSAYNAAVSSSTRGVVAGGSGANSPYFLNKMQYITMATASNTTDFGDLTEGRSQLAGLSSPTRGVFAGGRGNTNAYEDTIDYITIASTGNATDFGNLTVARRGPAGAASSTRGVFMGGLNSSGLKVNTIDYITIASTGNALDFGDITITRWLGLAVSNNTRAVLAGGSPDDGTQSNVMDYVTIASTGNATDFGDLTTARYSNQGVSNAHGGLQ